jgi:hypothetical protein
MNYSNKKLTSLKDLDISYNIDDNFDCSHNELTSLEHGPERVYGDFNCGYNELSSLEYGPVTVTGDYICQYNNLSSLEFCPTEIDGSFNCQGNQLRTLEYMPKEVGGGFNCSSNLLTQLEMDRLDMYMYKINGDFNCSSNKLTNLSRCPENISGDFDCSDNSLTNLDYHPISVGGNFYCYNNKWTKPIPYNTITKFNINIDDIYTDNQKEKFGSYKYQKNWLSINPKEYKTLEYFGFNDKIKEEFDWLFEAIKNDWDKHIPMDIIQNNGINIYGLYLDEQKEKFGSYKYQKEFLTEHPEKYKELEYFGYNDKIKEEFDWLFNAVDMGLM